MKSCIKKNVQDFKSLLRETQATTALEFGLVGPIFLLSMLVMFYVGLTLFIQEALDNGLAIASRKVELGQISGLASSQNNKLFYKEMSSASAGVINPDLVTLTVSAGDGFDRLQANQYGGSRQFVVARVSYPMPTITPGLSRIFGGALHATTAFQNEPY